jgi:hypothetical protein
MSTKAVECVSGVLLMNGAVLVEKRRADDDADPGRVLFPVDMWRRANPSNRLW